MILTCLQENLKRSLSVVMPAVAGKSTLPVLGHILLRADDEGLALSATNLETGITTRTSARVEAHGGVCLPAKLLNDLIAGLPNELISMELKDSTQEITIKCGSHKTVIRGIESDEFPVLVATGSDPLFSLPGSEWHDVADHVANCAAKDMTRPVLAAVHVFENAAGLTFEAADGHRLARKVFGGIAPEVDTLLPATTFGMVKKVFAADATVALATANSGALVLLADGVSTLQSRVIEGKFPDCDRIIPTTYTTRLVAPVADLLLALRLAKPFAEASSNIVRLDVTELADHGGKLGITANAAEIGDHSGVLDIIASGEPTRIALNVHYFMESLVGCGSGDVAIELQSERHPAVLRPVGDESMLQLVMSMTVK